MDASPPPDPDALLLDAARRVLRPLARLLMARGAPWATIEELLKSTLVEVALQAQPDLPEHGRISHVSAATGLNRREVARLVREPRARESGRVTPVMEVFARWRTDAALRGADGVPRPLPRTGEAPSFEALARSVTSNVHPRTLLDELCRLGLATLDEATDTVRPRGEAFVPRGDLAAMLGFLGDNVGDHLSAAVANVMTDGRRHFDQAIFADALSDASIGDFRRGVSDQWARLMPETVALLERLIEADRAAGRPRHTRVRVGLYTWAEADPAASPPADRSRAGASPRRRLPRPVPSGAPARATPASRRRPSP